MAKWVMVVETNCADKAKEAEFNEWYNKTHLPDVLKTPGFTRATRYENINPSEGEPKFLAIYEIETDDIDALAKKHSANHERLAAQGRVSKLLVRLSRRYYRQISSLSQ